MTDVIVASEAEASNVLEAESDARPWPWADMKGVDPVKLGRLDAVFRGGPYDDNFVAACETLASADDSVWVFRIPPVLTDRLAQVEPTILNSLAKQWSTAEEFALDRWQFQDVEQALVELARLARLARATSKDLLLWMSL